MASTLLAVDDSVTMRKVLEITFAGPDFRVVTANSPDAALQKLKSDKPDLVIADLSLDPNGYDLCKAIKKASPNTPVLILSSKQNAFDAAKGSAAQADDHMDKPFDTQQMIDKVKKLLGAQPATKPAAKPAEPVHTSAQTERSMPAAAPAAPAAARPAAAPLPPAAAAAASAAGAAPVQRAKTLIYNPPAAGAAAQTATGAPVQGQSRIPAGPTPVSGLPLQARPAALEATKESTVHAGAVAAQVNGQMTAKLEALGLTAAQVDAVLALSREVVERVAWEVVPVLAETIIKEEISRLTR